MGGVTIPLADQFASRLHEAKTLTATPLNDIFSEFDATVKVKTVDIDATANTGEDVFVKFYDDVAPTVGTTLAHMVLKGKAGVVTPCVLPGGGVTFPTNVAVSIACVQEKGGKEGTTAPSGVVDVKIFAEGTTV